ncbi:MAG: T9SS type B sorting domain-containing protein [Nonlabens sp.]
MQQSCSYTPAGYARNYYLTDFGIGPNEAFTITDIDFALTYAEFGANYSINIYLIDNGFPANFNAVATTPLYRSASERLPPISFRTMPPVEINHTISSPLTIPSGNNRFLVEIVKGSEFGSGLIHLAGTTIDSGQDWFYACHPANATHSGSFRNIDLIQNANPAGIDWKIYMKVNGYVYDPSEDYSFDYDKECGLEINFTTINQNNIQSISWDFDDLASATNNNSNLVDPSHVFSSSGTYNVTATITRMDGTTYSTNNVVEAFEAPTALPINDLNACEVGLSGFSDNFDTSNLVSSISGGQNNVIVTFYRQNGVPLPYPLPSRISNNIANSETITARVAYLSDLCCYSETTFSLITKPAVIINPIPNLVACETTTTSGFSNFNLNQIINTPQNNISQPTYEFYDSNNNLIPQSSISSYRNIIPNNDFITVRITDGNSNCYSESNVSLSVNSSPILPPLPTIYSCDSDNDGISNSFDISGVESTLLNNRTDLSVSYFDANGNDISSTFISPFTNTVAFNQIVTIEVTDNNTNCSSTAYLALETISQPIVNIPNNIYSCDEGNGFSTFDISQVTSEILNGQTNLTVQYYDDNGLINSLSNYQNITAYNQPITAIVSFLSNDQCNTSITFDLITENLPEINLNTNYIICGTDPYIDITVSSEFDNYIWTQLDTGIVISNSPATQLIDNGNYSLEIFKTNNGINCSNIYFTNLNRSQLPTITSVNTGSLGNNYAEIIAIGDGDFEYSVDGINYFQTNYFDNLEGGTHQVYVRDKNGCGSDSQIINIIDYPKYFTPNGDGYHDYWKIKGLNNDDSAKIYIYDRYGKLLKQISGNSVGWNGNFNSSPLPSDTYWFNVILENGTGFKGYFALKR